MPETKKPWRTLITGGPTGRFTREQIRKAVMEVKAEREAKETAQRKKPRTR
ncbi:MAG TPA: hypothetical protein VGX50_20730 [Longimicrobium sp.]|nr:hypothetical protein [Longimicrobium sp.]